MRNSGQQPEEQRAAGSERGRLVNWSICRLVDWENVNSWQAAVGSWQLN